MKKLSAFLGVVKDKKWSVPKLSACAAEEKDTEQAFIMKNHRRLFG